MKKSVLVTAVSGSGKSTTCKALKELGYTAYDIETLHGVFAWKDDTTGELVPDYQDDVELAKSASWICNKVELQKVIENEKAELAFYCGASSNWREIWDLFDEAIMLQVSDDTTVKRLSSRKPDEFGHTHEVREYVLSWKDELQNEFLEKGAVPVSAEGSPDEVAKLVIEASK